MKSVIIAFALVVGLPSLAHAQSLFHCTTTGGKQLSVSHQNGKLTYRFGKQGKPELVFSNTLDDAILYRNKYGLNIELSNGNTVYNVVYDHTDPAKHSGVFVSRNNKEIASVLCQGKPVVDTDLFYELVSGNL